MLVRKATAAGCLWCRAAAIQAGAVPALCSVLHVGAQRRVPIALDDVLRALYALAAADASGHSAAELFSSGGIHSLVRGPVRQTSCVNGITFIARKHSILVVNGFSVAFDEPLSLRGVSFACARRRTTSLTLIADFQTFVCKSRVVPQTCVSACIRRIS